MRNYIVAAASLGLLFCSYVQGNADTFGSGENSIEIEFVTIRAPGNPADTTGNPNPAGAVDYIYQIGKYAISRNMVAKANAEGGLGIILADMTGFGGNRPSIPATGVSWNEAARFTNWLNMTQGFPAAYKFSRQPGDVGYDANENILPWEAGDPGFNTANAFRNNQARYFLPSVDEWYKAAFYDPSANNGAGGYWDFPTGSDTAPMGVASGTDPQTAVYNQPVSQGPADITQAGGLSPFGVMGLGGNVFEWEETEFDLVNDDSSSVRGWRGGSWDLSPRDSNHLSASDRLTLGFRPAVGPTFIGFRVASIPEPSSKLLAVLGMLGLVLGRQKRVDFDLDPILIPY